MIASRRRFVTVPWAPWFEGVQLTREIYAQVRLAAVIWQLGIGKGFRRETVKARLESDPQTSAPVRLAIELGMLEPECSGLAEEFGK